MTVPADCVFHIPTKPMSIIDFVNRRAAATGSIHYAMASADADYNGHSLRLYFNDYRGYYVCEYQWGERVVLARNACFATILKHAKEAFARQGRGASLHVTCREQDKAIAQADPDLQPGREGTPAFWDWRFKELSTAVRLGWVHHLIKEGQTKEGYEQATGWKVRED